MARPSSRPGHLRIGVLGTARIVDDALLKPARAIAAVEIASVASRDVTRAERFSRSHGIPGFHPSYESLLDDPSINAVYIPLPAAMHAEWTIAAIAAGKHVLCEKPFASNAAAGERVLAADDGSVVVMEAYHTHYHPLHARIRQLLDAGELGEVTEATATFSALIPPGRDIRWNLALGGGALLDIGYYPVRALRTLFGEIVDISTARAAASDGIDRLLVAEVGFEGGVRGSILSSMWSRHLIGMRLEVTGTEGRLRATRPYHPHLPGSRLHVRTRAGSRSERLDRTPTYTRQLEAFRDAVLLGAPVATDTRAAVAQLRALDGLYEAAALTPRP